VVRAILHPGSAATPAKAIGCAEGGMNMPAKKVGIRPLGDRVIVKRMEELEQTKGGIIVPDTAKEKPQRGKVIAVGPGRVADDGKRIAPEVKKGNTVLFGKYSGTDISLDDEEYLILREDDILAIIE